MRSFITLLACLGLALGPAGANPIVLLTGGGATGGGGGGAGIAIVDGFVASLGVNGGTTAARDTTGANFITVSVSWYNGGIPGGVTVTDNKGNSYTGRTERSGVDSSVQQFYCATPNVGTGHTFTMTKTGSYSLIAVVSASGVNAAPYEEENGTGAASTQPGSVTPDSNGSLVTTGFVKTSGTQPTVASGGFVNLTLAESAGVNVAGGMAYLIQPTAAAVNPTWSALGSVTATVFKP